MLFEAVYAEHFPFWEQLSEQDQTALCQNTTIVPFAAEQPIHDNSGCSGIFLVKSGRLRLYLISEEGKEITLYRLSPGDICMLTASCVLESITFDVYVDAEVPSECYRVSGPVFQSISARVPAVRNFALEIAVQRFSDVMWVLQQIVFMKMDKRLAIFLLDEVAQSGSDTVHMTHDQIARHLGTAREVITRTLKRFASEGWISVTRKGIRILEKKELRRIAF